MNKIKIILATLPLALAGSGALADGETIAVFTKNQTNPYFHSIRVGAAAAAKSMNAKVVNYIPTKPDSIPEQLSQIEDVIIKKPSAIVFIPVDYKAMVPGIEEINKARIPMVNITDRSAGGTFLSFIGADDYSLARETARYALSQMGGKGNVIILEGVKGAISSVDRVRGFNDAVKEFKDVKLLASQPGNYQRLQALQVMENLMQSHRQIDVVLAANDAMAIGAIEALDGANRTAKVTGINATKEGIEAIKSGKMLASGDVDPFAQGCLGTFAAIRALRNEPIVSEVILQPVVVNLTNHKTYDVTVESRTCPSWEQSAAATKKN